MDTHKWGKIKTPLAKQKPAQSFSDGSQNQKQSNNRFSVALSLAPKIESRVVSFKSALVRKLGAKTVNLSVKLGIVVAVSLLAAYIPGSLNIRSLAARVGAKAAIDTGNMDVWWPTNGTTVSGSQPMKALLQSDSVENYKMYWQVDGGQLNEMPSIYQDYPHKESWVDYSGWTWKGKGPYVLTFQAKDASGNVLGQKSVTIYTAASGSTQGEVSVQLTGVTAPVDQVPASTSGSGNVVFTNGYPTINGNFIDCNGNVDNDMGHHVASTGDADAAHHVGQNCPAGSLVAKVQAGAVPAATPTPGPQSTPVPSAPPVPTAAPTPTSVPAPQFSDNSNPLAGTRFFINPNHPAKQQADSMRSWNPTNAALLDKIAGQPQGIWLGNWNWNVKSDVENILSGGSVPIFIAYNIPQRDCGGYSAGGSGSAHAYKQWVNAIADGINRRKAVVVLEPDALSMISCLSGNDQQTRYDLLKNAVSALKNAGAVVYLDAGHASWISPSEMATRLQKAGVAGADGFAVNVSNFMTTADNVSYGQEVSKLVGGKHFIVDTARNGNGPAPDNQWCNPSGRALGQKPTTNTGNSLVDGYLWLKTPGESDGSCNGGPSAGTFWTDYAVGLAQRASW